MKNTAFQNIRDHIDVTTFLSSADWIVFLGILVITFVAIFYGNSLKSRDIDKNAKDPSTLELLLMGRRLTLPLFIGTLVATWYGGIAGVTRIAFEKGLFNFLTQGGFWYGTYILFAFFLVDRVRASEAMTLPELIGKMFGKRSKFLAGIFNFFNVVPIVYVISLGVFIQLLFGWSIELSILAGTSVVVIYSAFGGFRAVVYSDLIQFFVMCIGVFLVIAFSYSTFGGIGYLKQNIPQQHFSWFGGESFFNVMVWGLIALSTLVDPNFYQRCFAAKCSKTAKKGILISTLIWVAFDLCTTFGALYARAAIPNADSNLAYLTYSVQVLPDGIRGFFLAGILATILSTLDSYLFLASTTITYDLLPKRFSKTGGVHVAGVALVGMLAVSLAYGFEGNIKAIWKTLGSYSAACLLLPVLFGYMFPGRLKDQQFFWTCIASVVTTTLWRHIEHSGFWSNVDEIYIGSATSLLLIVTFTSLFGSSERVGMSDGRIPIERSRV